MTKPTSTEKPSALRLITVPTLITLGITVLRLVGERQGWSRIWFNPDAGGGLAPVGIVWLVPIFGFYFAMKLVNFDDAPAGAGRVAMLALLGIAVLVVGFVGAFAVSTPGMPIAQTFVGIASILALIIQRKAWPSLFNTLLAYGFAARIPVTIIMFFAIKGNWGTHYDGPPPGFPSDITWFPKFILIGVIPQLVFWVTFTVIFGVLFGAIAVAMAKRNRQSRATAQA